MQPSGFEAIKKPSNIAFDGFLYYLCPNWGARADLERISC
jgi:hypothetical protein